MKPRFAVRHRPFRLQRSRWLVATHLMAGALCFSAAVSGAERDTAAGALRYRQVLVPESEVPTRVQQGFMPLHRERFGEMVGQINSRTKRSNGPSEVRVSRSSYSAKLDQRDTLRGHATLELEGTISASSALVLSPCNLAIENVRWRRDPAGSANVGTDKDGQTVLVVDHDGAIEFDWSLAGTGTIKVNRFFPSSCRQLRRQKSLWIFPTR